MQTPETKRNGKKMEKRIEIAKLFIAKLAEICGGDRGLKLTAPAKVWQGGNKVRIYGLARQGYVEILEDGTVRNEIDRPFPEIFEAIDAVAAELEVENNKKQEDEEAAPTTANEKKDAAEKAANLSDAESIKDLFNAAANAYYLEHTGKTFEELNEYLSYETTSWADGLLGDEWESIEDCIECAEEKAQQVIENE